ncbi:hypothetical protein [Pseudomonas sp. Irchel 3E20]|nr:hypothetical protein [Pseudomonas sp. Irchel 3E20]
MGYMSQFNANTIADIEQQELQSEEQLKDELQLTEAEQSELEAE